MRFFIVRIGAVLVYHGFFAKLVQDKQVVEVVEFQTPDPAMRGEMTITTTLAPTGSSTRR